MAFKNGLCHARLYFSTAFLHRGVVVFFSFVASLSFSNLKIGVFNLLSTIQAFQCTSPIC